MLELPFVNKMVALLITIVISMVVMVTSCPDDLRCVCDLEARTLVCEQMRTVTWSEFLSRTPQYVEKVWISDSEFAVHNWNQVQEDKDITVEDVVIPELANLLHLYITDSNLVNMDEFAFRAIPNILELHINRVNMTNVTLSHLAHFVNVEVVDLGHNELTEIPMHLLESWPYLRELDLRHNKLSEFSFHVFNESSSIKSLDLSNNNISFVHPQSFSNGTSLSKLNLQSNSLRYLHDTIVHNMSHSATLHLGDNPWACHCGMQWLVRALKSPTKSSLVSYSDLKQIQCASPLDLESRPLVELSPDLLECEPPRVNTYMADLTIHYMYDHVLGCNISGYPSPSVYWLTPHGPLVHPDHRYWIPDNLATSPDHIVFTGNPPSHFHPLTTIRTQGDGSLRFENFRYFFHGEYSCVAVNPAGLDDHSLNVTITNNIESEVQWTIIWGFVSAGGVFLLSIALGCVFHCVRRFCQPTKLILGPNLMRPDLMITYPEEYYDEILEYEDPDTDDCYSYQDYYDRSPLRSYRGSPRRSPMKCVTPAEALDDHRNEMSINIRERLESVRLQLRQNMERQMDKMKTRTQNLKQNSHRYMKNVRSTTGRTMKTLRHTSTQYAHKVREGVVMGVEQVKCHVQSMKELCGPGNIPHTISTISMSTDIDSNQKKNVFKSITYV